MNMAELVVALDFDDALEKMNDHVCGILRIILSGQHKKSMTSK